MRDKLASFGKFSLFACPGLNALLHLIDRLADQLDGLRAMAGFVVHCLLQLGRGVIQSLQRIFHVRLSGFRSAKTTTNPAAPTARKFLAAVRRDNVLFRSMCILLFERKCLYSALRVPLTST